MPVICRLNCEFWGSRRGVSHDPVLMEYDVSANNNRISFEMSKYDI